MKALYLLWCICMVSAAGAVMGWKPLTDFEPGKDRIWYRSVEYPRAYDTPWERVGYRMHLQLPAQLFCAFEKDRMERAKASLSACTECPGSDYLHSVICAERARIFEYEDTQLRECRERYPHEMYARLPHAETTEVQRRYFPFLQGEVLRMEEGQCYIEPSMFSARSGTEFGMACIPPDTLEWMESHEAELISLHTTADACNRACSHDESCEKACRKAFNKAAIALNPPRLGDFLAIHKLRSHRKDGHCCASEWL